MNFLSLYRKKRHLFFLIILPILQSCTYRIDRANIEGFFRGNPRSYIYISKFEGDSISLIDSIKTSSKGHFEITIKTKSPFFMTIGLNKIQTPIILLVQPSEDINIQSENPDMSDYKVFGSKGSALLRSLALRLSRTKLQIDSLKYLYNSNRENPKIDSIQLQLDSTYKAITANQRKYTYSFIKDNTFNLVSILALSQTYDSLHSVLDYSKDRKLFRLIDSSLLSVYSSNTIANSFHKKIQKLEELYERTRKRELMFKVGEVLPNVSFPLITGENLFFSGIWYRYALIDFWGSWCDVCKENNTQLRKIYTEFAPKGLVVLQVSLGINPDSLRAMVARDSMFWYHAYIPDAYNSKLLDTLKVTSIPSSYIIDRWGVVKGVNLSRESLSLKLKELLPK